jgi:long-chain acyl-CoA synthetase
MRTATADFLEAVGAHAAERPDDLATAAGDTFFTWLRLREAAAELGGTIGAWNLEPGARVVLAMPSSPGWVAAFLAGRRADLTLVSAGAPRSAAELRELCLEVGAVAVLADGAAAGGARAVAEQLGLGFLRLSDPHGALAPRERSRRSCSPEAAVLHFTSGSTGERKAVPRTEASLLNEGRAIAAALEDNGPLLVVSPVFHSFGAGLLSAALASGAPSVLVPSFSVSAVLASIADYSTGVLVGVPYVFHCLARIRRRRRYDLGSLRLGIAGGTPLHDHVARQFEARFGAPLAQEYGLSEVGVVSINLDDPVARPWSVGRPLPGLEAQLRPLPGTDDGELTICRSHERDPDSEEMVEAVATGDLARIDGDGFVEITGRRKHLVNVGGLKVAPHDVERRLLASCEVEEVAIVGCPDRILGERVGAAVVASPGMTKERFRDDCRRVLAPHEIPRRIAWLRELPRLSSGKPDLMEIRRLMAPGEGRDGK